MTKYLKLVEQLIRFYLTFQWFTVGLITLIFTSKVIKSTFFNIHDSYSFLSNTQGHYYLNSLAGFVILGLIFGIIGSFSLSLFNLLVWRKINFKTASIFYKIWVIICVSSLLAFLCIGISSFFINTLNWKQYFLVLFIFAIQSWGLTREGTLVF